jgi:hypothetical protein
MSRSSYTLTSDAFEALTAEAQAEILAVLEPHPVRTPSIRPLGGAVGGAPARAAEPIYPPAWRDQTMEPRPLRRVELGCAVHDGLYDGDQRVLGRSTTSGGIPPRCFCPPVARRLDFSDAAAAGGAAALSGPAEEDNEEHSPLPPLAPAHNTNDWFYHGRAHWQAEVERLTAVAESVDANILEDAIRQASGYFSADERDFLVAARARLAELRRPAPVPAVAILGIALPAGAPGDELEEVEAPPPLPVPASPVAGGGPAYAVMRQGADGRELPAAELEAVGTPPGSPAPAGPMWRTGSCGESGPFIGLGDGWSVELVRRWGAAGCGRDGVWALKEQMFADLPEEPDLLKDFTEQQVIDGMATSYGWSAERTRECLAGLRAERASSA